MRNPKFTATQHYQKHIIFDIWIIENLKHPFAFKMQSKFSEGVTWGFWPPQNCQRLKMSTEGGRIGLSEIMPTGFPTMIMVIRQIVVCLSTFFILTKKKICQTVFFSLMCQYVGEDWLFLNRLVLISITRNYWS